MKLLNNNNNNSNSNSNNNESVPFSFYLNNFHPGYRLHCYSDMYPEQLSVSQIFLQRCNLKDMDNEKVNQIPNSKFILVKINDDLSTEYYFTMVLPLPSFL